ncbi:MAG: hypothetical protein WCO84_08685 [bacterium]
MTPGDPDLPLIAHALAQARIKTVLLAGSAGQVQRISQRLPQQSDADPDLKIILSRPPTAYSSPGLSPEGAASLALACWLAT